MTTSIIRSTFVVRYATEQTAHNGDMVVPWILSAMCLILIMPAFFSFFLGRLTDDGYMQKKNLNLKNEKSKDIFLEAFPLDSTPQQNAARCQQPIALFLKKC